MTDIPDEAVWAFQSEADLEREDVLAGLRAALPFLAPSRAVVTTEMGRRLRATLENKGFEGVSDEAARRILEITLAAPPGVAAKENAEAHLYLKRLLAHYAPHCIASPDLLVLCTQIDNLLTGLQAPQPEPPAPAPDERLEKIAAWRDRPFYNDTSQDGITALYSILSDLRERGR
jgi:hypothetical protein